MRLSMRREKVQGRHLALKHGTTFRGLVQREQENVAVYVCVCVHRGSYFGVCEWHCTIGIIFSKNNYIK